MAVQCAACCWRRKSDPVPVLLKAGDDSHQELRAAHSSLLKQAHSRQQQGWHNRHAPHLVGEAAHGVVLHVVVAEALGRAQLGDVAVAVGAAGSRAPRFG